MNAATDLDVPQQGAVLDNQVEKETGGDKLEVFILGSFLSSGWSFLFFREWVFFWFRLVPRVRFSYSLVAVHGVYVVFVGTRLWQS